MPPVQETEGARKTIWENLEKIVFSVTVFRQRSILTVSKARLFVVDDFH